jgi:cytochrome d ubiquinol oxidase subunit I
VWFGAFILGAFFVMSISAWYLLRGRHAEFARRSFTGALVLALVFSLAQLVSGHLQAENVAEHQPAKLAAFEGLYASEPGTGMYLWGWPSDEAGKVLFGLQVPGALAWLVHGDPAATVAGLDVLEEDWGRPPVWLSFQSYHWMVVIGLLFAAATLYAAWLRWRGTLFETRWLLWFFVWAVLLAFAANQIGWVAAEVGRQPWIVYPTVAADGSVSGGLRTGDAVSEVVTSGQVLGSIVMFGILYLLLFVLWLTVLNHKIQHGPQMPAEEPHGGAGRELLDAGARRVGHADSLTEAKA